MVVIDKKLNDANRPGLQNYLFGSSLAWWVQGQAVFNVGQEY